MVRAVGADTRARGRACLAVGTDRETFQHTFTP